MSTLARTRLTPSDHGREIDPDEFEAAEATGDYRYEIINGRVYAVTLPNMPEQLLDAWLYGKMFLYSLTNPEVVNLVTKARVFVHDRPKATRPEPDVAAYQNVPRDAPLKELRWQDHSPLIVAEVVSADDPDKDFVRNVGLYLEVPSIKEYWVLDGRDDPDRPTLTVYRRRGAKWQKPIVVAAGETYESPRILPGFSLVIDPRR